MAHKSQQNFFKEIKDKFPSYFSNKTVLDIGSLNINGCNKPLFEKCKYIGLDIGQGPNVDVVSKAHEYDAADESFDVIVSSSCFEHDMYYDKTFNNAVRVLKSGGLFFFTCDGPNYHEHGTLKTNTVDSPFTTQDKEWGNYYKNLVEEDIRAVLDVDLYFSKYEFSIQGRDLRFWGIKK